MALNVTINNTLASGGSGNTAQIAVPTPVNPGYSNSDTSLSQSESLDIHIGDEDTGGAFQIGIKPTDGTPSLTVKRTGNHWKITNKGTDTETSVIVGPDGQ